MSKKVDCSLETRVSKKGNSYQVLVIKLTPNYEKLVFLDNAELELLSISNNKTNSDILDF